MNIIYGNLNCERSVRIDHISIVQCFKRPDLLVYLPQFNFIPKALSIGRVFQDFELDFNIFKNSFPEFVNRLNESIGNFSGGERRLLELYVVVMSSSQFVFLDEPFTHLNPLQIEKAKEMLLAAKKANKGLLITDHMFRHVQDISDNIYVLTKGNTYLTKTKMISKPLDILESIRHSGMAIQKIRV